MLGERGAPCHHQGPANDTIAMIKRRGAPGWGFHAEHENRKRMLPLLRLNIRLTRSMQSAE